MIQRLFLLLIFVGLNCNAFAKTSTTTFVDIRDALFFDTAIGSKINNTYYTYSPLVADAIKPGMYGIPVFLPSDPIIAKKVKRHYKSSRNLSKKPTNFSKLGPLFITQDSKYNYADLNPIKGNGKDAKAFIKDIEHQAGLRDQNIGIRRLGSWGLYSLEGFFRALPILAVFILLLIAGAMGRYWLVIIPPLMLLVLLSCYKPEHKKSSDLKTAVTLKDERAIRELFLNRTKRLRIPASMKPKAAAWMADMCANKSIQKRFYGAALAGELGLVSLREQLINMAKNDPVINVRYMAIEGLSKLSKTTNIIKELTLNAPSLYEKHYALDALLRRNINWQSIAKIKKTPKL